MPTVPRVQGPQVGVSEGNAFRPMGFEVPTLPDQTKQIRQGVRKGLTALDKLIEQQDEARVTVALTELRKHAIDVESGDNGFRKLLGENALMPDDDGVGLVDRVDTDMHQFGDGLMARLNDRQRKLFTERAQPIYLSSYGSVSQHVRDQGVAYAQNQTQASIDQWIESGAAYAGQSDKMAMANQGILEDVERLAQLQGLSEEQKANLLRKSQSGLYMNSIAAIMSNADMNPNVAYQALGVLQNHSREMLASDVVKAKATINGYLDIVRADESARRVVEGTITDPTMVGYMKAIADASGSGATPEAIRKSASSIYHHTIIPMESGGRQMGDDGYVLTEKRGGEASKDLWRYGAAKVPIDKAREAAESRGIKFDEKMFLKDAGYNKMVGEYYFQDLTTHYAGDMDKTFAAYYTGMADVDKAVEESMEAGDGNWVSRLGKDAQDYLAKAKEAYRHAMTPTVIDGNGEKVNALSGDYAKAKSAHMWMTENQYLERLLAVDQRARVDPKWRERCMQVIENRVNREKQSYVQAQNNLMIQAQNALYNGNGAIQSIPVGVWQQLDYNQQEALQTLGKKIRNRDESTDWKKYNELMSEDGMVLAMNEQEMMLARSEIGNDEAWSAFRNRYYKLHSKTNAALDESAVRKQQAASGNIQADYADISTSSLDEALKFALGEDANDQLGDKHSAKWQSAITGFRLYVASIAQGKGQEMKGINLETLAKDFVSLQLPVTGFWGPTEKPLYAVKASDFKSMGPTSSKGVLTQLAERKWKAKWGDMPHEVSDNEILDVVHELFTLRSPDIPSVDTLELDEALWNYSAEQYKKQNGGREPTVADNLRLYIMNFEQGVEVPTETEDELPVSPDWGSGEYSNLWSID